ncbi:uncharacterized protein B0T15DRAFT_121039 [Chaetomium strumarium]|uniref:Uncharacterized protein n=1 Tax=Chaetomium strumarium TaxID=1170767 RepID=A0AAJ0GZY5_9PEZI|nr:hypothetical protein B0T15DRAFT_121039 [Chaetomium strumarium]
MSRALRCAALSCALGLAEAKALKWGADAATWVPARETVTFGVMSRLGMIEPTPTPAPYPQGEPRKVEARGTTDNTCGYMSGILTSSLYCDPTASCVYNESNMHIGCCDDGETRCPIWTTCYDSTDSAKYTTRNGLTLWCGQSEYPHCFTHTYEDQALKGYTVLGCAVAGGTGKVWYSPTSRPSSSDSSSTSSTSSISDPTSTSSSPTTRAAAATDGPNGGSNGDSNSDGDSNGSSSSSTPVGPIVGGVVGGLGAVALIILGIWMLMRQRKKGSQAAAAAAATQQYQSHAPPPPGPGHQDPHMSQYYGAAAGAGFSPMDPRASIAKPPAYAGAMPHSPYGSPGPDQAAVSSMTSSPPHSPSPAYHPHGTPSPPPPQQQPGQFGQPQPQPQQQAYGNVSPGAAYPQQGQPGYGAGGNGYPQQQQQYTAELPATRGDGELRELQG